MKPAFNFTLAVSAVVLALSFGCQKPPPPPTADTPKAALPPPTPDTTIARLTEPKPEPAILPHKVEPKTEFPQAMASLAPDAPAPKVEAPPPDTVNDPNRPPTKGLTADGVTTELVMHDWTGVVLVPLDASISRAHTVLVAIDRIEAHPLDTGQVRVWARIRNITDGSLPTEVACSFRTAESPEPDRPIFYKLGIPRRDYRDVFFLSPPGKNLNSYTVLVRSGDETTSATGQLH